MRSPRLKLYGHWPELIPGTWQISRSQEKILQGFGDGAAAKLNCTKVSGLVMLRTLIPFKVSTPRSDILIV